MATLPDERSLGERPAIRTSGGVASIGGATGYEGVAARNQLGVANDLTNTGDILQKAQNDYDQITAQDAINKLNQKRLDLENEAKKVQGADAANPEFYGKMRQQFDEAASGVSENLTPNQKRMFQPHAAQSGLLFQSSILNHVAHQSEVNADNVYKGTIDGNLQDASQKWNNPPAFEASIVNMKSATAAMAARKGLPPELVDRINRKNEQEAWRGRVEMMRESDPVGAMRLIQDNEDKFDPAALHQLSHQVFTAAAPVLAAQVNLQGGVGVVDSVANQPKGKPFDPMAVSRGVRNNNPGNITQSDTKWQGEVSGTDPRYASFDSPESGIRALGKTLLTYSNKYGLNTVQDIVSRWAPASENDTQAYIKSVSKALGVEPDAQIDVSANLTGLTKAIIAQENGKSAIHITDAQIKTGLDAAVTDKPIAASSVAPIAIVKSPSKDPSAVTGIETIDALSPDRKMHVLQLAEAMAKEKGNDEKLALGQQVKDTAAEYRSTGIASNPPRDEELIRVYGQIRGVAMAQELKNEQLLGQNIQSVKSMPNGDIANLLKTAKPEPGEGFAQRQADYQHLTTAVENVIKARQADPGGYAISTQSYGWKPIADFNNVAAVTQELQTRAQNADKMARDYGVKPTVLTGPESKAMASVLRVAPIELQKQYLASMYQGVNGDMGLFKSTMQGIAPDAPVIAQAGMYQAKGYKTTATPDRAATDTADLVLRGYAILNPVKSTDGQNHQGGASLIKMPDDKSMLSDWNSVTGSAFKGKEQAGDLFQQTAKAIYAARSAEDGDYTGVYNPKRWKAAIELATGGVQSVNGAEIVMPYGMPYDKFQDALKAKSTDLAKVAMNATADEIQSLPLENVGDGTYYVRRGVGYLVDKSGRPVIANFNEPEKVIPLPKDPTQAPSPVTAKYPQQFAVTGGGAVTGLPTRRK